MSDGKPLARRLSREERYRRSWRGALNRRRYERVMRLVGLRPTDRILDLGCGKGRKSVAYYNRTNPIVGLDRFPIEKLDQLGENFRFEQGDASDLRRFPDGAFDVVVSFGLLEHLTDEQVETIVAETPRLADRYAHVVPHPWAFVEPHARMPLFGRWPAALRSLYSCFVPRRHSPAYWQALFWRSAAQWRALFGDENLGVVNHWYGPLLLYQIIHGRVEQASRRPTG
jgi:SAM-dependent methyltransferase